MQLPYHELVLVAWRLTLQIHMAVEAKEAGRLAGAVGIPRCCLHKPLFLSVYIQTALMASWPGGMKALSAGLVPHLSSDVNTISSLPFSALRKRLFPSA